MGVHKVALYTETIKVRQFYKAAGMRVEGEHPNHWWGIKHYCLAKDLQPETKLSQLRYPFNHEQPN
jgi:hypothetical protein